MIQGDFQHIVGAETIGSLRGHLGLVVETLHAAERYLSLGPKPVEQKFPVGTEHLRHLLHRFEPGTHGSGAPRIKELARPGGVEVLPEALEVLFEQVGPDRLEVAFEQILQPVHLLVGEILRSFQQAPAASCQLRLFPLGLEVLGLLGSDLIDGLAHMAHYMEAVENINRVGSHLRDYPQVGLPHVTANEPQVLASLWLQPLEEAPEGLGRTVTANPEQPSIAGVKLIDQGDELLLLLSPANLIGADSRDPVQVAVFESPIDRHFDRADDTVPTGVKRLGHLFPAQPFGPGGEEPGIGNGEMAFPLCPWHAFNLHATGWATDPSWGVEEESQNPPEGDEFKAPLAQGVIAGASLATARTYSQTAGLRPKSYLQSQWSCVVSPFARLIDKTWLFCDAVHDSL